MTDESIRKAMIATGGQFSGPSSRHRYEINFTPGSKGEDGK